MEIPKRMSRIWASQNVYTGFFQCFKLRSGNVCMLKQENEVGGNEFLICKYGDEMR